MLFFYDSGLGSFYDLCYVIMCIVLNLVWWDYYILYVSLLLFLVNIDWDFILRIIVVWWEGYVKGKRVKYN